MTDKVGPPLWSSLKINWKDWREFWYRHSWYSRWWIYKCHQILNIHLPIHMILVIVHITVESDLHIGSCYLESNLHLSGSWWESHKLVLLGHYCSTNLFIYYCDFYLILRAGHKFTFTAKKNLGTLSVFFLLSLLLFLPCFSAQLYACLMGHPEPMSCSFRGKGEKKRHLQEMGGELVIREGREISNSN